MPNKLLSKLKTSLLMSTNKEFLDLETRLFETREQTIEDSMTAEMENPLLSQEYVEKSSASGEQVTDHTRLLAKESIQNQKKILEKYNWDEDLKEISTKKGQLMERQIEEEAYQTDIFLMEEIKAICMDFNMKFRPAKELIFFDNNQKYEIVPVIEEFTSKLKYDSDSKDYDRFYALAIAEDFANEEERSSGKKAKSKEPRLMLFYLTDKKKKTFVHVNSWGSTKYSVTRYLNAWAIRNPRNAFISRTVKLSAVIFILAAIFGSGTIAGAWFTGVIGGAIISAVWVMIQLSQTAKSKASYGKEDYSFTNESWDASA
jgi:hypothetical protein